MAVWTTTFNICVLRHRICECQFLVLLNEMFNFMTERIITRNEQQRQNSWNCHFMFTELSEHFPQLSRSLLHILVEKVGHHKFQLPKFTRFYRFSRVGINKLVSHNGHSMIRTFIWTVIMLKHRLFRYFLFQIVRYFLSSPCIMGALSDTQWGVTLVYNSRALMTFTYSGIPDFAVLFWRSHEIWLFCLWTVRHF